LTVLDRALGDDVTWIPTGNNPKKGDLEHKSML
jgi:hypothetical protein